MSQTPAPAADPDLFTRYRLIRDEIVHEDGLIGQRLGWFLASQAFLLTALAIANNSQAKVPSWGTNYFFPLVPLVALATCILIFVGVLAGFEALTHWRRMMEAPEYADVVRLPRIRQDHWMIRFGWTAPIGLPVLFFVAWLYLLLAGLGLC